MRHLIQTILLIFTNVAFGQIIEKKPLRISDFPSTEYLVKSDTFTFYKNTISLTQIVKKGNHSAAYEPLWRAWITVTNSKQVTTSLDFTDDIKPCKDIEVRKSPSKNYFILTKFGSLMQGKFIFVDTLGRIFYNSSDTLYITPNNRYLYSYAILPYERVVTVYDLQNDRHPVFTYDSLGIELTDFYVKGNKYFVIVNKSIKDTESEKQKDHLTIMKMDLINNKYSFETVDKKFMRKAKRLEKPCACN